MWRTSRVWADLRRDGFVHVPGAFVHGLADVRQAMASADLVAGPSGYGRIVHDTWRRSDVLAKHLLEGVLAELAARALGGEAVLFQDHLVSKTPGTMEAVKWHQDYSYWPLDAPSGVTMWVALDDADVDNGCLHYARGSHRDGEFAPADFVPNATLGVTAALPPIDLDGADVVSVPVRAGDVLLHDPLVLHTSPGNTTERQRRAWSITWLRPSVRWRPEHAPHPYNWALEPVAGERLPTDRFPIVRL